MVFFSWSRSSSSNLTDVVGECLHLVPLPYLNLVFSIFRTIYDAVQEVQVSQEQLRVLIQTIAQLLYTLDRQYRGAHLLQEATAGSLRDLTSLLDEIATFVQKQSSFSFFKLLLVKNELISAIGEYHLRIATAVNAFQIAALVDIQRLQRSAEEARIADQDGLHDHLCRLEANQRLLANALASEKHSSLAVMVELQRLLRGDTGSAEERQFFQHSLRYLTTTSGRQVDLRPWTVTSFEVEFGSLVGTGGFAQVYRGRWNNLEVALKVIKNTEGLTPREASLHNEVEVHHASLGLAYLHSRNIAHGDVKGVNILIQDGPKAVLCDFGLSRIKADFNSRSTNSDSKAIRGSQNWMAPELLDGGRLRLPCDVYSFGMTLYEVFTDEIPLGNVSPARLPELIVYQNKRPERPTEEEAPELIEPIWDLAALCWTKDPSERPPAMVISQELDRLLEARDAGVDIKAKPLPYPKPAAFKPPASPIPSTGQDKPLPPLNEANQNSAPGVSPALPRTPYGQHIPPTAPFTFSSDSTSDQYSSASTSQTSANSSVVPAPALHSRSSNFFKLFKSAESATLPCTKRSYSRCLTLTCPEPILTIVLLPTDKGKTSKEQTESIITTFATGFRVWTHSGVLAYEKAISPSSDPQPDPSPVLNPLVLRPNTSMYAWMSSSSVWIGRLPSGNISSSVTYNTYGLQDAIPWKGGKANFIGFATNGDLYGIDTSTPEHATLRVNPSHPRDVYDSSRRGRVQDRPLIGIGLHALGSSVLRILCAAFTLDGCSVYVGLQNGMIICLDTQSGQRSRQPFIVDEATYPSISGTTSSPMQETNQVASPPGSTGTDQDSSNARTPCSCVNLAISPDSKRLISCYASGEIRSWDLVSKRSPNPSSTVLRRAFRIGATTPFALNTNQSEWPRIPIAFSSDSTYVILQSWHKPRVVEFLDASSGEVCHEVHLKDCPEGPIVSLGVSPNFRKLWISVEGVQSALVFVWD